MPPGTFSASLTRADLPGRHLLGLRDLDTEAVLALLDLAAAIKADPGRYSRELDGKILAMLFEKPSLRTVATFQVGMIQLGGNALYFGPDQIGLGKRESVSDVAKNLSRWVDIVMARVFEHSSLEQLALHGSVPVVNGLCDVEHPCQALGDFLTLREHKGELAGRTLAWVGDGNNVAHSLMLGASRLGIRMTVATPPGYEPAGEIVEIVRASGADLLVTNDPMAAVAGADAVYTDVWASMGQEDEAALRAKVFHPYQVNTALMKAAGHDALFMHCLPAHRGDEVTDAVMDSAGSIVFDQAENRLHIQKAVLLALLAE